MRPGRGRVSEDLAVLINRKMALDGLAIHFDMVGRGDFDDVTVMGELAHYSVAMAGVSNDVGWELLLDPLGMGVRTVLG